MTDNEKKMIQDAEEKAENKDQDIVVEEVTTPEIPDDVPPDRNEQSELFEAKTSFEQKVKSVVKNKPMALVLCVFAVVLALILCSWSCISPANADNEKANDTNNQEVEVKDTTAPTITFSKEEVNLKAGESFAVPANIKVVDDTDGNLKEVEKIEEGKAGYVIDDEKLNTEKAGTYTVSVTASDSAGNKAKSSFSVKVTVDKEKAETETESKEAEKTESKSESSSSNSSVKSSGSSSSSSASKNTGSSSSTSKPSTGNTPTPSTGGSNSTSKPSTGSGSSSNSGSSSSSNTSKPSTGSSTSSGSSTASKPSTGSGSSDSSGGSTAKPVTPEPVCKDVVVVDYEAYDEQVLVKEAYDETILVKEAWDEPYAYVIQCVQCGTEFPFQLGDQDSLESAVNAWDLHALATGCENNRDITKYIHHDAEYQTVHHDAEYQTVHHDAVTHVVKVCS